MAPPAPAPPLPVVTVAVPLEAVTVAVAEPPEAALALPELPARAANTIHVSHRELVVIDVELEHTTAE